MAKRLYNNKTGKAVTLKGSNAVPVVDLAGKNLYVLTTAVTSGVTTDASGAVAGDLAVTTHATGRSGLFVSDGTHWVAVAGGASGFTQGVTVAAPTALTSAAATGGDAPTEAEYNALRTDVSNLRTTVANLLTSLKNGAIIA